MELQLPHLIAADVPVWAARVFLHPLREALRVFEITSPASVAALIAQASFESQGFTKLEENLYYRSAERIKEVWPSRFSSLADAARYVRKPEPLANFVYANRLGNGDKDSGDGWQYRGRGIFQLTGRANYMAAGDALRTDYKGQPWLATDPADACFIAAWYWSTRNLSPLADSGQFDLITERINGSAMLGASTRRANFDEIVRVMA